MQRNRSLDLAKGIAIVLMVIGHCYSSENEILRLIYAFHMPFFFIVSGMLYAEKWKETIQFNLHKSARRLLIPYFVFELLFAALLTLLSRPESMIQTLGEYFLRSILPGVGVTATWYLPCSFLVCVMFVALCRLIYSRKVRIIITVLLVSLGLCVPVPRILTALWRGLVGLGFFGVGFWGKEILSRKASILVLIALAFVYAVSAHCNGQVSMVSMTYSNPVLYLANGILGSYLLIQLSMRICAVKECPVFERFGKDSVIILCTHMMVIEIARLLDYKLFGNVLVKLGLFEGILFGALVLVGMYWMIPVMNRHFKFLFGK